MLRSRLRAKQGTTSPRFGPLGQHDALHRAAATFHPDDRLVAKIYAIDIPLLHYDVLPVPGHRSRCCRGRGRPLWHRVPFRHNRSDMRLRGAPAIRHRRPASGPGARPCARPHRSSGAFGGGVHSSNASRAQPNPQIRVCEIRRHFQAILGTGIGGVLLIRYQARIFLFAEQYRGALRRGGDDVASLCVLIGACPGPPEHRLRKLAKAKTIGCWQFHSSRTRNHVSATVYRGLPAMVRIGPHARSWLIAIPAKLAMTFFSHTFLRLRTSGSLCKAAYVVRAGRRLLTGACNQRASASSSCKVVTFVPQALHLALRRRLRMLPSAVLLTARCTAQPESPSVPNSRQKKKVHKRSQQLAPRLPGKTGIVLHMLWLLLEMGPCCKWQSVASDPLTPSLLRGAFSPSACWGVQLVDAGMLQACRLCGACPRTACATCSRSVLPTASTCCAPADAELDEVLALAPADPVSRLPLTGPNTGPRRRSWPRAEKKTIFRSTTPLTCTPAISIDPEPRSSSPVMLELLCGDALWVSAPTRDRRPQHAVDHHWPSPDR